MLALFFFFNDTATTEIYTLSLHDALPISSAEAASHTEGSVSMPGVTEVVERPAAVRVRYQDLSGAVREEEARSEEHTSELQSRQYLVCRLLLEKKNTTGSSVQ